MTAAPIAAIYPRVSGRASEDGYSLDTQEAAMRKLAAGHGSAVANDHVYREVHTGVELWERPQLTRLRAAVRARSVGAVPLGHSPAALATPERDIVAIYLPIGGEVAPTLPPRRAHIARWFDPRTAELRAAAPFGDTYRAPGGTDERGHPWDWVLVLTGDE